MSSFFIDKRYNYQLMCVLNDFCKDVLEGYIPDDHSSLLDNLSLAAQFFGGEYTDCTDAQIVFKVIVETQALILEKGNVLFVHEPDADAMKLNKADAARLFVLSSAVNYAVETWLAKYEECRNQKVKEHSPSIMDLDNLAAMLDRHVHRQLVHYNLLD